MNKALKTGRNIIAALMLIGLTALLLDTTGVLRHYTGWIAKIQLLPAVLAGNVIVVLAILIVTLLAGRVYCSVVCPLGIFQDIFIGIRRSLWRKKKFHYMKPQNWLRYVVLGLFVLLMLIGLNNIALLIAPYSAYARMLNQINGTGLPLAVAIGTAVVMVAMSFLYGRLWCNTICPVGALLSLVSRYSVVGIRIDNEKCVGCKQCEQSCKSMCIKIGDGEQKKGGSVDRSRCVNCFHCINKCKFGAISFGAALAKEKKETDGSRRRFIATSAAVGAGLAVQAQEQKLDGGLAIIMDKQVPERRNALKPAGAKSLKNFASHCTGCQLCVSQCPEKVLRPSTKLATLMQPEMNYHDGYCRTACHRCSDVCPTGAIRPLQPGEKTTISIGVAVCLRQNCLSASGTQCGACARHCPAAAISMRTDPSTGHTVPSVDESRCIGCGACEYYCPARPQTAIYVEGREVHTEV